MEFELIIRLTFGLYPDIEVEGTRLKNQYFNAKLSPDLDDIEATYYTLDFRAINDLDAIKLTLYFILECVMIG